MVDWHIVERQVGTRHNPFVSTKSNNEIAKSRSRRVKKLLSCDHVDESIGPLTESELKFCREYAIDHNGTRAYRLAFPTKSYATAKANASRLLTKANVRREIAAIEAEHLRATGISARRVLRELAAIAFADLGDVFEEGPGGFSQPRAWDTIPPLTRRTIANVKVKRRKQVGLDGEWIVEELDYKFPDKLSALDKLAKHLGLTSDGEAIRQLLELVQQSKQPATPAEGRVDRTVDPSHGPTGPEVATTDRSADKPLPANR